MNEGIRQVPLPAPGTPTSTTIAYARRVAAMGAAWMAVGLLVGFLGRESVGKDLVGAASSMLAGAIVLLAVGLPTVLLGGRGFDALLGATLGGISVQSASCLGWPAPTAQLLSQGVIMGALFATTGRPLVAKLLAIVRRQIVRRQIVHQ